MKKIIVLLLSFTFLSLNAQKNVAFDSERISDPDKLELAKSSILLADELSKSASPNYLEIEELYIDAYDINKNNAELNFKLGKCKLYNYKYLESEKMFKSVVDLGGIEDIEFHYFYGRALHFVGNFDQAIEEYYAYSKQLGEKTSDAYNVKKRIEECKNAKLAMVDTAYVTVRPVKGVVNTVFHDYSPVLSKKGDILYFTSKRASGGELDADGQYKEDIYQAELVTGDWTNIKKLGKPLNSKYNDASVAMSIDGKKMVICREKDVFMSKFSLGKWTKPKPINDYINTPNYESTACFSYDGKRMYFVSNRPEDNLGGTDIYYSEIDDNGKWGKPKNLGNVINTEYNEDFVFLHPDGRTMYFASKGHNSMGGYDIYQTKMNDDGMWSEPLNMGYPINTSADEVSFVLSPDGHEAYVASSRVGGKGFTDIYVVTILGKKPNYVFEEKDMLLVYPRANLNTEESPQLTILQGKILDESGKVGELEADIIISNNETGKIVTTLKTEKGDGSYMIALPSGKDYGLTVSKKGYLFHSENFVVPKGQTYKEIDHDINLKDVAVGNAIVLRNVSFEKGNAELKKQSSRELDNVVQLLEDNPKMRIEIIGYAENKSQAEVKAKTIVDYLSKFVDKGRIVPSGLETDKADKRIKIEVKVIGA